MSDRRIVVTGMGAVSGFGPGVELLWKGLLAGERAIGPFSRFDTSKHRTQVGAQVPPPLGSAPTRPGALTLSDRFAVAAAREALGQAGLAARDDTAEAAVIFGSSTGGMFESEQYYASLLSAADRPRLSSVTAQQYNGPGDAVARELGVHGPVETLSSACTSAALAITGALDLLRADEAELALAGGSDSLCQLTYAGFNSLRAVDHRPCRPFETDRAGLSLGEGAAVLVLETADRARGRGATPLVELVSGASTCDAHHMTAPAPDGAGAAAAMRQALDEAGLAADAVDFVNAHGTGTSLNDVAEWRAIAAVFGKRASTLPVTASKSAVGHLLGAAGAIEAVATVLSIRHGLVHPTAGGGEIDPRIPLLLVRGEPLPLDARCGLSVNLAFGGSNSALVFRRWEEAA